MAAALGGDRWPEGIATFNILINLSTNYPINSTTSTNPNF
jgi:hypothetical protein